MSPDDSRYGLGGEEQMAVDATSQSGGDCVTFQTASGYGRGLSSIPLLDKNGSDNSAARESQRKINSRIADDNVRPQVVGIGVSEWWSDKTELGLLRLLRR